MMVLLASASKKVQIKPGDEHYRDVEIAEDPLAGGHQRQMFCLQGAPIGAQLRHGQRHLLICESLLTRGAVMPDEIQ